MFYEAKRNQWIKHNPFEFARKNEIIKSSDRKKRNLFLTFNQEIKLLKACETEDRRHLRALIIVAVDTGARFGELINLTKAQLDFSGAGTIYGLLNYKDLGGDKLALLPIRRISISLISQALVMRHVDGCFGA